jgi:hypothetical protein
MDWLASATSGIAEYFRDTLIAGGEDKIRHPFFVG